MSTQTGDEFLAHQARMLAAEKQDQQPYLGHLLWYEIPELNVPHEQVVQALAAAGVTSRLPLPPRDSDVFRRVSSKAARKHVDTDDPGVFANYLVRDIPERGGKTIIRRIVMERVDAKGHKLSYDQLLDVVFDRATSAVTQQQPGDRYVPTDTAVEIANQIGTEFTEKRGCLNGYAVREWIRHFLLGMNATPIRPAVYFVKEDHVDRIHALETLTEFLPGETMIHSLPLVDDTKQREMVRKAYEAECAGEIDKLLTEIAELTTQDEVPMAEYQSKLARFHDLIGKNEEYGELLEESLDVSKSRLTLLQLSVMNLLGKVKAAA